jgi:transcriptional regulator with XRE-family HTH domain
MPNRIKELREARGMTLDQVGEAARTSAQQISRLEKGERRLTDTWMHRIAGALGVTAADLLANAPPNDGEFVKKPDEIALLRWWRLLIPAEKRMIAAYARDKGLEILIDKSKRRSA